RWVFFGGEGVIAENRREEQRKIVKYQHLVANLVIFHRVARSPAPHYPQNHLGPGSLAPNFGDHGPSDSALAASSAWRLRRPGADRHAARCASRDLCSGGAPRRYSPSNVVTMTKVIRELVAEGHPVTTEMLAVLSPYPTAHLNRLGRYTLQLDQVPDPIEYDLPDALFPPVSSFDLSSL